MGSFMAGSQAMSPGATRVTVDNGPGARRAPKPPDGGPPAPTPHEVDTPATTAPATILMAILVATERLLVGTRDPAPAAPIETPDLPTTTSSNLILL
jgi:hypothetical protein